MRIPLLKGNPEPARNRDSAHCTSCGAPIPPGQGKSCSMCYGDIDHGRDGYYRRYIEEQQRDER
jgi:hypothetical protein